MSGDNQDLSSPLKVVICGRSSMMVNEKLMDTIMKLSGKKPPHVAYFGTPRRDKGQKYEATAISYETYGCIVTKVKVWNQESTDENDHVASILDQADIVLISGGSSKKALEKWRKFGIDKLIINTARRHNPPVFVGGSAGAVCLSHTGLGIVPVAVIPHYDTLGSHPSLLIPDQIFDVHPNISCICLDENASWIIDGNESTIISIDGIARGYHVYRNDGVVESSSLPCDCIIPLSSVGITTSGPMIPRNSVCGNI
jgi:peptidase E